MEYPALLMSLLTSERVGGAHNCTSGRPRKHLAYFQWIAEIHIEGTGKAARFVLCASFKIGIQKLFRPLGRLVFC